MAADGEGANGLYTEELLRALCVPGLKVEEVFKQVRVGVTNRSRGAQTPWESSSLTGDLVVNVNVNVTVAAVPGSTVAPASPPANLSQFDGTWAVTVDCPAHGDAAGYVLKFFGQVKDGVLLAQHDTEGQPSALMLKGKIQPDGSAAIDARGITGESRYNVKGVATGTPYSYRALARFEGSRGTGDRIDLRPCSLSFAR